MAWLLLICLILIGCENEVTHITSHVENAANQVNKINNQIQDKIKTKNPQYKLGKIDGLNSHKVIKHLAALVKPIDDQNFNNQHAKSIQKNEANILNVEYTITSSPLLITTTKKTVFNNLLIKVHIKYCNEEKFALLHYRYLGRESWKYDDALYYLIAQKIIQAMTQIEEMVLD